MEGKEQSQSRRKQEQGVSMRKGETGSLNNVDGPQCRPEITPPSSSVR